LVRGQMFDLSGKLVASSAQEGLLRLRETRDRWTGGSWATQRWRWASLRSAPNVRGRVAGQNRYRAKSSLWRRSWMRRQNPRILDPPFLRNRRAIPRRV